MINATTTQTLSYTHSSEHGSIPEQMQGVAITCKFPTEKVTGGYNFNVKYGTFGQ